MKETKNYYKMKWYQKVWYKISNTFINWLKHFKFSWLKLSIFLLFVIIMIVLIAIISKNTIQFPSHNEYDKTGFVDINAIKETEEVIDSNNYNFTMDLLTTHFTLTNKSNNVVIASNSTTSNKIDTLVAYYSSGIGKINKVGSYAYSVNYEDTKHYMIRKGENSIEVLYKLGGKAKIDYSDFPELINKEHYQKNIIDKTNAYLATLEVSSSEYKDINRALNYVTNSYKPNEYNDYYKLDNPQNLSNIYIKALYKIFYEVCGFTKEDLDNENRNYNITVTKSYPTFEIAIKYTLTNEGLTIEIMNDSIVDYASEPLIYVDILPYLGCASIKETGYTLIPDGSGVLLDYNNTRSYSNWYEQRIYGRDYAYNTNSMLLDSEKISLPLYGVRKVDETNKISSFINIIENGAESCSMIADIVSKIKTNDSNYNKTYYRYYYRETDTYKFSSLTGLKDIQTWTNEYNKSSLKFNLIINENEGDYPEMAKTYQKYLIQKGVLVNEDQTNDVVLDLTMLGGYLEKTNFIGIPYEVVKTLTTPDEIIQVLNELKAKDITNINLFYDGWCNDGIKSYSMKKINNSRIASNKKLMLLNQSLKELQVDLYPVTYISTAYTTKYLKNKDLIKNVYGETCCQYANNEANYSTNRSSRGLYHLLPSTYETTVKALNKKYQKIGFNNISINDLLKDAYGSYQSKAMVFKYDVVESAKKTISNLSNVYNKINAEYPNDYGLSYVSKITNLPFTGTSYQVVNCSVPFYQLVISGYLDYSANSFNLNDAYSSTYYKMKAIETLSNIAMTWTFEKTIDLIGTEYDYYYSTYYMNWLEETISLYQEMSKLNIYNTNLVDHQILNSNGTITKSIYGNGIEIIFNYTNDSYNDGVNTILPNSYMLVKEGR